MLSTCQYLPRFVTQYIHMGRKVDQIAESIAWQYAIRLVNKFDHTVFSTKTQYQAYLEHGLTTPVTIISNGVDTINYHPTNGHHDDVDVRYQLPAGPRILFVGRLAKDKDIDVLIRAMPALQKRWGAHLLLVGRGDDQERLEGMTDELGLSDYVHFMGFVPEADLPALYRTVDIFAIASTCEVQSIPTLQAAATGLPIVAVNAAALPELVEHGGNGYLVPPEDPQAFSRAIGHLLSAPEKTEIFAQRCLEIGQAHADAHTFDAYEKLYNRLLMSEDSRRPASLAGLREHVIKNS